MSALLWLGGPCYASAQVTTRPSLSVFTGAGGLDVGLETAGFSTALCVENNALARDTLAKNRPRWRCAEPGDIHDLEPEEVLRQAGVQREEVDLLAGGPPCQPWSKSGQWQSSAAAGWADPRASTIDAYIKLVEGVLPRVVLLENVNGLASPSNLTRLRARFTRINRRNSTRYVLSLLKLNAADYGIPQLRQRVFLIADRDGQTLTAPRPTHGEGCREPYRTAWDAIGHLDRRAVTNGLAATGYWAEFLSSIPEGCNYLAHAGRTADELGYFGWRTKFWSFLLKLAKDKPAWTIQAAPGPATGPFHWRNRRLSVAELAALQTFPPEYVFPTDYLVAHRQIGNAVPCALAELIGLEIRRQLFGERVRRKLRLIPKARDDRPRKHPTRPVSPKYSHLLGHHVPHAGNGRGPAPRA
jgi:DNA (cytosine-5)-methyltransferase 1